MNSDVPGLKRALRARLRIELEAIPKGERTAMSEKACHLLTSQECWQEAGSILFYVPLDDELDLTPLWPIAAQHGKIVTLPRYRPEAGSYGCGRLESLSDPLVRGQFGILEPAPHCPWFPLNQLDLILVPGVAFDLRGRRMGRGRGFYDRLLPHVRGTKCGVAFDRQVLAEIPAEPHDVVLNWILTPTRWLSFGSIAALE